MGAGFGGTWSDMEPGPGGFHRDHFASDHDYDNRVTLHKQMQHEDWERGPSSRPVSESNAPVQPWTGLPVAIRLTELERWLTVQEDAQTAQKVLDELPQLWTYKAYQESTEEEEERLARLVRRIARLLPAVEPTLAAWEAEWVTAAESSRVSAKQANARVLAVKAARDAVEATGRSGAAPASTPAQPPGRSVLARLRTAFGRKNQHIPPSPGWWDLDIALGKECIARNFADDSAKHFAVKADRMTRFMEVYRAFN